MVINGVINSRIVSFNGDQIVDMYHELGNLIIELSSARKIKASINTGSFREFAHSVSPENLRFLCRYETFKNICLLSTDAVLSKRFEGNNG